MAFIGGGVMTEAILSRAIALGVMEASNLTVSEPVSERRLELSNRFHITTTPDNVNAASDAAILLIAVKPQHVASVMKELSGNLSDDQTVVSIAAGISIETLTRGLSHTSIIRVMPNTPAKIGAGMSVWTATPSVPTNVKLMVSQLLKSLGAEMYVTDEEQIDTATAISGSGPAYLFMFAEALTDAGIKIGMTEKTATVLTVETILGAARMLAETGTNAKTLRQMVTSPGGTTAEALKVFENEGFGLTIGSAVNAAYRRAKELGRAS
jgi:pyrroline-5-carboxylate reductase